MVLSKDFGWFLFKNHSFFVAGILNSGGKNDKNN